jgi:hypothetical protein
MIQLPLCGRVAENTLEMVDFGRLMDAAAINWTLGNYRNFR